jgi:hypothetical protein
MSFLLIMGSVGLLFTNPAQQQPEVREVATCVQRIATSAGFSGGGLKQNGRIPAAHWWRDRLNNGNRENLQTRIVVKPDSIIVTARLVPDLPPDRTLDDAFVTGRRIVSECSRARVPDSGSGTQHALKR